MRIIDTPRPPQRPRPSRAALSVAFTRRLRLTAALAGLIACCAAPANAETSHFSFAVIGDTMHSAADEPATQRLIEAIGRERDVSFIVYNGNLKGAKEACSDGLY
jgi:hypothetical protein